MKQRETKQRALVLRTALAHHDHPSADEIYLEVRAMDDKISRGTVYRNLKVLADNGELTHVKVPGADRYDRRLERHYHLICTSCGAICDVPAPYQEEMDKDVEVATGYLINRHRTVFEGLCPKCREKLNT